MCPSPLTRRQALQAAGSSLVLSIAGCAADSTTDDTSPRTETTAPEPTETPAQTVTKTPTSTPTPTFSPVKSNDLRFNVEVLQQFNAEHPAEIEATLENTSERPVTASGGATFPFGFSRGDHMESEAKLLAIPFNKQYLHTDPSDENFVPAEPTEECWTVDYDLHTNMIGIIGELTPGTVHSMKHTILDWNNDSCLPAGTYRFAYSLNVSPGGLDRRDRPDTVSVTFSFAFILDEDRTATVEINEPEVNR